MLKTMCRRVINRPCTALSLLLFTGVIHAADIINPGFEEGWHGWTEIDKDGKSVALSSDSRTGGQSAKITSSAGSFAQLLDVKPDTDYVLSAQVLGSGIIGVKMGRKLVFERQGKTKKWTLVEVSFNTGEHKQIAVFAQFNGKKSLFDDFSISEKKGENTSVSLRLGVGSLSPDLPPGRNFDLLDWYLNTPGDDGSGRSQRIPGKELRQGYQHEDYFYTADDGGMVFRATIEGKKTSKNTRYTRTELREMLRRGDSSINTREESGKPNRNNWVFSTAPEQAQKLSGGVDGRLRATLAVNHVTTTGEPKDIGRVVIGQIHANRDEPIRLYYRKLPNNERGSIYAAHEDANGEDTWFEIIGSRSNSANDPVNGIALNEKFSYEINAEGHRLDVRITRDGVLLGSTTIDMTDSGYDTLNDYMYFKAGVYNQNDSGEPQDYVQATFYALENTHKGYEF